MNFVFKLLPHEDQQQTKLGLFPNIDWIARGIFNASADQVIIMPGKWFVH